MSAANAAAIRRRVNSQNNTNVSNETTTNLTKQAIGSPTTNIQKGFTLPQVISNLDTRVKMLESNAPSMNGIDSVFSPTVLDEFNSRFEILANELADLKGTIMKLQTFTMEVNKSMHDERINILSEVGATHILNNVKDISDETSVTSANIKDMAENELHE